MFTYLLIAYLNGSMTVVGQYSNYNECNQAAARIEIQTGARAECVRK